MASAVEEQLLSMQFPLIPGECRKMMCSLAHQMRLSFKRGAVDSLSIPMTTRSLIRWARTLNGYRLSPISLGDKLSRSFMLSLGNRLTQVDRIAVNELADSRVRQRLDSEVNTPLKEYSYLQKGGELLLIFFGVILCFH